MSGMVNTIVKNHFQVDLNFHPIRVIRSRNSDPNIIETYFYLYPFFLFFKTKYTNSSCCLSAGCVNRQSASRALVSDWSLKAPQQFKFGLK